MKKMPLLLTLSLLTALSLHADDSLVVAEATLDVNGDGRPDTVQVVMVHGEKYIDAEPSCHMSYGGTPWYRGRFVVRVQLAGQKAVETELGLLFGKDRTTLEFNGSGWPLVFQDLNHDGRLEFTLGQYATCNGSEYIVLGIDSTGHVSALSPTIYMGGHTGSTDVLHPSERGFRFSTPYSASTMSYSCTEFDWHAKEGRFIEGATLPESCSEDEHGDANVKK